MIDPEMLAAILKELGYFDEYNTDETESETRENEQVEPIGIEPTTS